MRHFNFKSKFLITLLGLLTLSISQAWGETSTISADFQCNCSQAGTNPDLFTATGGSTGDNYYTFKSGSVIISDKAYTIDPAQSVTVEVWLGTFGGYSSGKNDVRFCMVNKNGTAISSTYTTNFTAKYTTNGGKKFTGTITLNSGQDGKEVYFKFMPSTTATSSVCSRFHKFNITYTPASEKTNVSLNANGNGKADGSVKYTVGKTTPDATPSWVTPKDNTGWILNGYYTAASGGTKIITASNTLVANTTYADASNKWKYEGTTLTLYAQWGKTACETPSNLEQNDVTATSATLTWDAVVGAASYRVYISDMGSYLKEIDNINTNSITLNDLSPNTEYLWSVTAIGDASKGYDDGKSNDDGDFTTEQACTNEITISKSNTTLPIGCSFSLDKTSGCGDDAGESVLVTCSPATHYTVTAVSSTSGTPGTISNNKCTVSGIKESTTISVTFTENTKYTITFVDAVHGEGVAPKSVYENETFTFPSITDKTAVAPTGDCVADHYHFIGWVEEGTTPTQSPSNVITAGTTSTQITKSVTYKAVWAKEEL